MILFEDEHLLAINKPAGMNTHSPGLFAGEGIYEWLKNREPRWANLAILHRLDKDTSGVMLFGKSALANRSLTTQFAERKISKKYLLLTDREISFRNSKVESVLVRAGEKYLSRPIHSGGERAETRFRKLKAVSGRTFVEAEPLTGKTHQIRVHAAASGFPILGDTLYGGTAAERVFLHAAEISFQHPATGKQMSLTAPENFSEEPRLALRAAVIEPELTNAFRLVHGASDGWPGFYVERLGDFLLSQSERDLSDEQREFLKNYLKRFSLRGAYHKILNRRVRQISSAQASPQLVLTRELGSTGDPPVPSGDPPLGTNERPKQTGNSKEEIDPFPFRPASGQTAQAGRLCYPSDDEREPSEFLIRENGIQFALSFNEGYSVGLFLDQRENRRRFLTNYIAPDFFMNTEPRGFSVLNTFAYTCGFSVCAAKAGATVTSLDLSKKYLEWGKRNFLLNEIDPAQHDFIYGDTFDWLKRFAKKNRRFNVIILDPPTFSQSKEQGAFRAEKDFGKLAGAALPLIKPGGVLFASSNAAGWRPENFVRTILDAAVAGRRKILQQHYVPQPPDFPISRVEPAYLKTIWLRVG